MDNLLKKLLALFSRAKSGESVVGIDIGSSSIKAVQIRRKSGRAILETYGEVATGPYAGVEVGRAARLSQEKTIEALKDLIREASITTTLCGVAIPLASSMVTHIEMPAFDEKQLPEMIPIEARKYIPVPISEVTLDWSVIPKSESRTEVEPELESAPALESVAGADSDTESSPTFPSAALGAPLQKLDVLIAAIHNEVLSNYQSVISGAGLSSSFFEIEVFSTIRATLVDPTKKLLLFDMGATATKLYIVEDGIVRAVHIVNHGSQELSLAIAEAFAVPISEGERLKRSTGLSSSAGAPDISKVVESTLFYIFSEAARFVQAYQNKNGVAISGVMLSGGGVNLQGFVDRAREALMLPTEIADPFALLQAPAFLDPVLKNAGPEFAVAIGVALRHLQEAA